MFSNFRLTFLYALLSTSVYLGSSNILFGGTEGPTETPGNMGTNGPKETSGNMAQTTSGMDESSAMPGQTECPTDIVITKDEPSWLSRDPCDVATILCNGSYANVNVSDPENCSNYFLCNDRSLRRKVCPDGQAFDWMDSRCVMNNLTNPVHCMMPCPNKNACYKQLIVADSELAGTTTALANAATTNTVGTPVLGATGGAAITTAVAPPAVETSTVMPPTPASTAMPMLGTENVTQTMVTQSNTNVTTGIPAATGDQALTTTVPSAVTSASTMPPTPVATTVFVNTDNITQATGMPGTGVQNNAQTTTVVMPTTTGSTGASSTGNLVQTGSPVVTGVQINSQTTPAATSAIAIGSSSASSTSVQVASISVQTTTLTSTTCEDSSTATYCNYMAGFHCYDPDINSACCASCQRIAQFVGFPGCEYGDKIAACASISKTYCYLYEEDCCRLCKGVGR